MQKYKSKIMGASSIVASKPYPLSSNYSATNIGGTKIHPQALAPYMETTQQPKITRLFNTLREPTLQLPTQSLYRCLCIPGWFSGYPGEGLLCHSTQHTCAPPLQSTSAQDLISGAPWGPTDPRSAAARQPCPSPGRRCRDSSLQTA